MKKFLSVLLSIAMIASMAVVSMAATTLPAAIDGVIKLKEDVVLNSTYVVDGELTIDLAGFEISGSGLQYLIHVPNSATLTIEDSSEDESGVIVLNSTPSTYTATIYLEGALDLYAGTIKNTGSEFINYAVDMRPNAWGTRYTETTVFNMYGGSLVSSESGVRVTSNSSDDHPDLGVTFNMYDGTIDSAYDGIFVQNYSYKEPLNVKVVDGTVTSKNTHAVRIYGNDDGKVDVEMSITGGIFTGKMTNLDQTGNGEVAISGGTFTAAPADEYLVSGYATVKNEDDTYTVVKGNKVTFNLADKDAIVTVYKSNNEAVKADANGEFVLENGEYEYEVSMAGYYSATGKFTVEGNAVTVDVEALKKGPDGTYIVADPSDAKVEVKDEAGETYECDANHMYDLVVGKYTYTVSKDGYHSKTGTIEVVDGKGINMTVTLVPVTEEPKVEVSGSIDIGENDQVPAEITVTIDSGTNTIPKEIEDVKNNGDVNFGTLEEGFHNVVIDDGNGNTKNVIIEVTADGDMVMEPITLPVPGVETTVETSKSGVMVDSCVEAEAIKNNPEINPEGKDVTVNTVVEPMPLDNSKKDQKAIAAHAGDKTVDMLDITLTYKLAGEEEKTHSEPENLIKIVVPFAKGEPTIVYRYHDDTVDEIGTTPNDAGEYFKYVGKDICIYAKKFSTYAIAYTPSEEAQSGGSGIILEGPYLYKPEYDAMMDENAIAREKEAFEYGEPVYYLIVDETLANGAGEGYPINNKKYVEKLKVKAEWNMGGSAVESVSVVKKFVDRDAEKNTCNTIPESGYYYFLEIVTAEKKGTAETDVAGIIEFDRKNDNKKGVEKIKDCKVDIDFTVFYPRNWLNDNTIGSKGAELEWDTPYVLKFDYDDETELTFGSSNGGHNEGVFTVDVSGQGKIYMEYSTEPNEAIAAANEGAKMDFLTFSGVNGVGVKFNRTGEFVYEMEDAAYAYRVVDGKLAPIAGLEVEDDEFIFNTNRLEAYVFSDTELVDPA